jgi:alpha-L-fucosidase 2
MSSSSSDVEQSSSSSETIITNEKDNFHIYLAFGQSNMEGQNWNNGSIAYSDVLPMTYKENVDPRFQVMTAVSGSYKISNTQNEQRAQGQWYKAVPPLARNNLGLSPADYFGRTLVAGINDQNVKVGVIVVAVAGAAIEGFEKGSGANNYLNTQQDWMKNTAKLYDNNPYQRLLEMAKEAQKTGVIKGIIMHQGESGAASGNWAQKVKGIYENLLNDLELQANSIPFLAGQPYGASSNQNNAGTINGLCNTLNTNLAGDASKKVCHVVSSSGCGHGGDNLHFSYEGYKTLGEHYGEKMLEILY